MNEAFGKDFYRKGNSVKRFGPFSEPPDSETEKLLSSSPSRESTPNFDLIEVSSVDIFAA